MDGNLFKNSFSCFRSIFRLEGSNNRLPTELYDKRDDFDFHIVNFPFLSSNIPSSSSYGVYISQLVRYAHIMITLGIAINFRLTKLLSQGYEVKRLRNSFAKF